MKPTLFTGSGVAIITPFTETGVDFEKLGELLEFQIANKTDAIIVCGTTGETPTMTTKEREDTIRFTVEKVNGRIPVIAGTGANDTKTAIAASKFAEEVGVDGILSVVPYYNKPNQRGLYAHFKAIAEAVKTPIILYNIPGRTGISMNVSTVKELSQIDNIVGVKECDFNQVGELVRVCGEDFSVYSGDDPNYLPAISIGAKGVVSVMANIIPEDTHNIYELFTNGDFVASREIQLKTLPLVRALFSDTNPAPTKVALNLLGKNVGTCRLPIVDVEEETVELLKKVMTEYGLTV